MIIVDIWMNVVKYESLLKCIEKNVVPFAVCINKKDKSILFNLIAEKVQSLLVKNNDGDNDYMILRFIEVAENLGLETDLMIDKTEYFAIAKKYKLPRYHD